MSVRRSVRQSVGPSITEYENEAFQRWRRSVTLRREISAVGEAGKAGEATKEYEEEAGVAEAAVAASEKEESNHRLRLQKTFLLWCFYFKFFHQKHAFNEAITY